MIPSSGFDWEPVVDWAGRTAGDIIAGAVPAAVSAYGVHQQNEANERIARENRQFQERMSNTAYQRATEDMRRAGINPMLAYSQGGASSPGGSTATMQDVMSPAVSSAMHAVRMRNELQLVRDQMQKVRAETNREHAQSQYWWGMRNRVDRENAAGLPEFTAASAKAAGRLQEMNASATELSLPGLRNIARIEGGDVGQVGAWARYLLNMWKGTRR